MMRASSTCLRNCQRQTSNHGYARRGRRCVREEALSCAARPVVLWSAEVPTPRDKTTQAFRHRPHAATFLVLRANASTLCIAPLATVPTSHPANANRDGDASANATLAPAVPQTLGTTKHTSPQLHEERNMSWAAKFTCALQHCIKYHDSRSAPRRNLIGREV